MSEPVDSNPFDSKPFNSSPGPAVSREAVAARRTIPQVEKWIDMIRDISGEQQKSAERTDQTAQPA